MLDRFGTAAGRAGADRAGVAALRRWRGILEISQWDVRKWL